MVVQVVAENAPAMGFVWLLLVNVTVYLVGKEMNVASQIALESLTVTEEVIVIRPLTHLNVSTVNLDGWARHVMTPVSMAHQTQPTLTVYATAHAVTDSAVI